MSETRFRLFIIVVFGLLAGAVWTLPNWWSVVNRGAISEIIYPGLADDLQMVFVSLPAEEQQAYFDLRNGDEDAEIAGKPEWALALIEARFTINDVFAAEGSQAFTPPAGAPELVTGQFAGVDETIRRAEGSLVIYQRGDQTRLLRLESDFSSSRAPDIHLIFTRNPDPTDERGVGVDYIEIAALRGNVGGQNYEIPAGINFNQYPILALYSPTYDAVLATATLR